MLPWLQKEISIASSILFRGTWPCTAENFSFLRNRDIQITPATSPHNSSAIWELHLRHPQWGDAKLICLRDFPMPPHVLVDFDSDLIQPERDEIKACGTAVSLVMESSRKHLLRDRKNALFYMRAVLGDDGIAALDHDSQKFWSRGALEMETSHHADADVLSLFCVHYVRSDAGTWLHTHGMDSMGLIDFDILDPHESVAQPGSDIVRAIALGILEGELKSGDSYEFIDGKPVHAVPVSDFLAKTNPKWLAIREDMEDHRDNRVVICDPTRKALFGLRTLTAEPSSLLTHDLPDGTLIHFSTASTELMSTRARLTYPFLRSITQELAPLGAPSALVKIGYQIDGGDSNQREHLWFEVHECRENEVDATLLNQPFRIARMKEGDRAIHSLEHLTDWQIFTPVGPINPRQTRPLRYLRHAIATGQFKKEPEPATAQSH